MAAVLFSKYDDNWLLYKVTNSPSVKKRRLRNVNADFQLASDTNSTTASRIVNALSNGMPNDLKFMPSPPFNAMIC